MLRIWADFNAMTEDGKVFNIATEVTKNLEAGVKVILYEPDDFEVEATLMLETLGNGLEVWFGIPNWDTQRDISGSGSNK